VESAALLPFGQAQAEPQGFDPSVAHEVTYHGSYAPLRGQAMTPAYESVVHLSLDVKAGLLIRQTHHWAANVFIAAVVLHLLRIFFTGAYRKPRELTYWIGLTMLVVSLLEGYLGYSLADDLLSGMGLAIGNAVALSIPFIGGNLAALIWDGPFPGGPAFFPRMYIVHVFLIPALLATLLAVHLALVALKHHTQFRQSPRETERKLVGVPTFPGQAPRSLGLFAAVVAVLFLLGGLVQINPIWLWGPYHVADGTNGAQPDWYLGWLIGALRMMPNWEPNAFGYTIPNPFFGGAAFPALAFGVLFAWPWIERFATGDRGEHHLLDRPHDAPWRTAFGAAFFTWVVVPFVAGSADRVFVGLDIPYEGQILVLRVLWLLLPAVAFGLTLHWMRGVRRREAMRAQQAAS